jgi:hypothetical protein
LDNELIIASVTPSARYSVSGSPLVFSKGRTATELMRGPESTSTGDQM